MSFKGQHGEVLEVTQLKLHKPRIYCSFFKESVEISVPLKLNVKGLRSQLSDTYSSVANKMQRYTTVFITTNALHVSGGSSTHHQELKTVYTASGICQAFSASYHYREWVGTMVRSRKSLTNTRCCVYSFELLMMGGGTAWNM